MPNATLVGAGAPAMRRSRKEPASTEPAAELLPRLLNECQHSQAVHPRAIKQLLECRARVGVAEFLQVWVQCIRPLFLVSKREPAAERVVHFASSFTACQDEAHQRDCEEFFEGFLSTLVEWSEAVNRTVRFRACQIIAEVVSKLDADFPVEDEVWERVTSAMVERMKDRHALVRVFAASALSPLVIVEDIESCAIVKAFRAALEFDPSPEVRKMVLKSMPAMNATVSDMVERIADVSEAVRKSTSQTIGERLPLRGLSITQRATTIDRGLRDRAPAVRAECEKLLEQWLRKDCEDDPLLLLRYLDVETNEKVGEMAMRELLQKNLVKSSDAGLRTFLGDSGSESLEVRLMTPEEALFWRVLCTHAGSLAETKGCEAATAGGAEAVLDAAVAVEQNDYLETILPPTVADFVRLVEAHLHKGSAAWFAARQLVLLANLMNFTDATSRRDAAVLLQRLLREPTPSEEEGCPDDSSPSEWVGDGVSLGGEESWGIAVGQMARHVHASQGEFETVFADVVAEVGRPCREGGADVKQWLHCLAVSGLLFKNIPSVAVLHHKAIEPEEIIHSLLLPAVKHLHPEVQSAGVRVLGMFCGLERNPSPRGVQQLFPCLDSARTRVREMALRAFFDLILCHGPAAIDNAVSMEAHLGDAVDETQLTGHSESRGPRLPLLEILLEFLRRQGHSDFHHQKTDIVPEGFAKVLLQSHRFPEVRAMQERILEELFSVYFGYSSTEFPRLKQVLALFFRIWCSITAENKKCVSNVFILLMRKHWPGYGKPETPGKVMGARQDATQFVHFMVHLLQLPSFRKPKEAQYSGSPCANALDEGSENLAIRLCLEVMRLSKKFKKLPTASKAYVLMVCRVLSLLRITESHQEKIKALLRLIPQLIDYIPEREKTALKVLREVVVRLKGFDRTPDQGLSDEELELFMVRMGFHERFKDEPSMDNPTTPESPPTRTGGQRASGLSQSSASSQTTSTRTLRSSTRRTAPQVPSTASSRPRKAAVYQSSDDSTISSEWSSSSSDEE